MESSFLLELQSHLSGVRSWIPLQAYRKEDRKGGSECSHRLQKLEQVNYYTMIETIQGVGMTTYESDNGYIAVVKKFKDHIEISTFAHDEIHNISCATHEKATSYLRDFLHAMPMQEFLKKYKGILNQKGLAKMANRSVNYMSHVATGRRPTSEELNKAIELAVRDLAKDLSTINII